jgi:hypothetical protein
MLKVWAGAAAATAAALFGVGEAAAQAPLAAYAALPTMDAFEQSQIMADALNRAGKSVDLVVLSHEDHWLSHGDTRLQMLQATMDFLAKNNPAK